MVNNKTIDLFSLGKLCVSDFVGENTKEIRHELKLVMEEDTKAVRLATVAPLNIMFGRYFYRSGINNSMRLQLKNVVDSILSIFKLKENDLWIDCASNDGTLLSFVPKNLIRVGIDPAEDSYKKEAEKHADLIIQDYFSAKIFKESKFGTQKCKIFTSIAVFYDINEPDKFCKDVYDILDDNGLWIIQLSHSGLMIKQNAFDNLLSEHVYYYTLSSLNRILERNGFKVVDCSLNETNGGSFRVYVMKQSSRCLNFGSAPFRDVCEYRINSLLCYEREEEFDNPETWLFFYKKINILKDTLSKFIKQQKEQGKSVWAYSASTKGNTLLQYCGLDNSIITAIADKSHYKWGLKTVCTNIPIVSEDEMRKAQPDFLLILAWHFIVEFTERESEYLQKGGRFIVPCPSFQIIEK